ALPEYAGDLVLPQGLPDPGLRSVVAGWPRGVAGGIRAEQRGVVELDCRRGAVRFCRGQRVLFVFSSHAEPSFTRSQCTPLSPRPLGGGNPCQWSHVQESFSREKTWNCQAGTSR